MSSIFDDESEFASLIEGVVEEGSIFDGMGLRYKPRTFGKTPDFAMVVLDVLKRYGGDLRCNELCLATYVRLWKRAVEDFFAENAYLLVFKDRRQININELYCQEKIRRFYNGKTPVIDELAKSLSHNIKKRPRSPNASDDGQDDRADEEEEEEQEEEEEDDDVRSGASKENKRPSRNVRARASEDPSDARKRARNCNEEPRSRARSCSQEPRSRARSCSQEPRSRARSSSRDIEPRSSSVARGSSRDRDPRSSSDARGSSRDREPRSSGPERALARDGERSSRDSEPRSIADCRPSTSRGMRDAFDNDVSMRLTADALHKGRPPLSPTPLASFASLPARDPHNLQVAAVDPQVFSTLSYSEVQAIDRQRFENMRAVLPASVLMDDIFRDDEQTVAEEERLAAEKESAAKIERERLAAEKESAAKIERERLAMIERERLAMIERERLAAEKESAAKIERERLAEIERERLAEIERERLAEIERERLAEIERERLAELAKLAADQLIEEERLAAEEERLANEEAERLMKEAKDKKARRIQEATDRAEAARKATHFTSLPLVAPQNLQSPASFTSLPAHDPQNLQKPSSAPTSSPSAPTSSSSAQGNCMLASTAVVDANSIRESSPSSSAFEAQLTRAAENLMASAGDDEEELDDDLLFSDLDVGDLEVGDDDDDDDDDRMSQIGSPDMPAPWPVVVQSASLPPPVVDDELQHRWRPFRNLQADPGTSYFLHKDSKRVVKAQPSHSTPDCFLFTTIGYKRP